MLTPGTELLRLFRVRKASPLEVMQAVLARIEQLTPQLNAYVTAGVRAPCRPGRGERFVV